MKGQLRKGCEEIPSLSLFRTWDSLKKGTVQISTPAVWYVVVSFVSASFRGFSILRDVHVDELAEELWELFASFGASWSSKIFFLVLLEVIF